MKTILLLQKQVIFSMLFLMMGVVGVWGQTTYTGSPTTASGAICPTANEYCGTVLHRPNTIKAFLQPISGNVVTIRLVKCTASESFGSGTMEIRDASICGSLVASGSVTSGATSKDLSFNVTHTGVKNYRVVFISSGSATLNFKYYSNNISITGTVQTPANLELTQCIGYNQFPNTVQGTTVNTDLRVKNTGGSTFNGTLYVSLHNSSGTYISDLATWTGVSIAANGTFNSTVKTSPAITQAIGNGYRIYAKSSPNSSTFTTISSGSTGCSNYFNVNITAPPSPNLELTQCIGYTQFPNTVQGTTVNTDVRVKNTGGGAFNGTLYVSLHNSSGTYISDLATWTGVSIAANGTYNSTVKTSPAITQAIGNGYRIYAKSSPNGSTFTTISTSSTGCSNYFNVNITAPPSPNLELTQCIGYTQFPNTVQGTTVNTDLKVKNTGASNFNGTLYVSLHNSSGTYITDLATWTGVSIAPNITYNAVIKTSPAITQAIGNGYRIYAKSSTNGSTFTTISTGATGCSNHFNINITAPPACITWTPGTEPTGDKLTAANYLCNAGIIDATQNGSLNATQAITREFMSKITYLGIYKNITPNSPAANFPVPFTDMQNSSSQWLTAVKVLSYLQFADDTTPFDRDFINFKPIDLLQRKYALKVLLEAFNITLSTNTSSPYTDFTNTADPEFKYVRTAFELGLLPSGTIFNVANNVNITREDLFVALWKILSTSSIPKPTAAQLNNTISNYFVPGNYRTANSGMVPELAKGNFNHYQKTSFSIAGRGVPLDFTHTYNSFLTELPKGFFEEAVTGQTFTPLGIGWTHTYNIYAQKVDGYTFAGVPEPAKLMVYYPDGSINSYNYTTGTIDGVGNYDVMVKTAISGGERITITTKGQMKYVFENYNNSKLYFIKTIKDRNNNGVKINYANYINNPQRSLYRISSVQEEFNNNTTGRSLTFNYPSTILNVLGSVTDNSIGRTISFNVNLPTKSLTTYTDPKGQVTSYTYDDFSNYNKSNLLTRITLPKGNKIENTYIDRKLRSSKTFAQNGVASSTTNVNWTPTYSSSASSGFNSTSAVIDPQMRTTNYTYDSLGNPTSIAAPANTIAVNTYGTGLNANLPTSITVDGINSTMSYDARGNLLSASKNGITNSYTYTTKNDVSTHTDGRGFTTNYSYDANGNATSVTRPSGGGTTSIVRNSFGQASTVTNPSGILSEFFYNTNGILNNVKMPLNIETNSTYDAASRLLSVTDANSRTNSYLYDPNDNLTQSKDANNEVVQHTYDQNDNHLSIKNPKNETQSNAYKFDDDLLLSESFGPHTKSYTYNTDGTLATHTRGNGTFTYTYQANTGRLLNDGQTQYTYDSRGNVSTITNTNGTLNLNYDNNDRMTSYTDYYSQTVAYQYDENNNVTRITYPGNKQVNYVYDSNNRCTKVTDWNNKITNYTYLTDDRILKIVLPNGTFTDYTYDAAGRPTGITNKKSNGTVISSYAFTMDNAGNHLSETINEPSIVAGLQTIANSTINYGSADYNRISTQGSTSFTHNVAGGITQAGTNAYTYDLNDNLLTAPNSTFSYDGAGNRRAKTVSGTNTRYVLSILGMSQVLMENNSSNAVQNYYVYGPTGLLYRIKANNTNQYYHYDYRGSTTAITNEAQTVTHSYSYDPFGRVLASTEADFNPYRYVGKQGVAFENDKLVFMRARYYDPTIGRFLSEDPVWALNLYPYADNNPIMNIDPKGELSIDLAWDSILMARYGINAVINNKKLTKDQALQLTNQALSVLTGVISQISADIPGSSSAIFLAQMTAQKKTFKTMSAQDIADGIQAVTTDVASYLDKITINCGCAGIAVNGLVQIVGLTYDQFDLDVLNYINARKKRVAEYRKKVAEQKKKDAQTNGGSVAPMPSTIKLK